MPNQQTEAEKLVAQLRELVSRAESMEADQRRFLDMLRDATSRTQEILARSHCRRCDALMTEEEYNQSFGALTLHARTRTDNAGTQQRLEWVQAQMPLCLECVDDTIQEHLGLPPGNRARLIEQNARAERMKEPRSRAN
jgi:hypothetical protein